MANQSFKQVSLYQAYGWSLAGVLCFSLTFPMTRLIIDQYSAEFITFFRSGFAGLIALILLLTNKIQQPNGRQLWLLGIGGVQITILFPWLTSLALQTLDASFAAVIAAFLPLGTAIAAAYLFSEYLSLRFWCAAVIAALLLALFGLSKAQLGLSMGIIWLLLAIPCASLGYAMGGHLSKSMPAWQVICWMLVLLMPVNLPLAIYYMPAVDHTVTITGIGGLLYLAIFSQLVGFLFWNTGLAQGGIAKMSQLQLFQPLMTLIFAQFLFAEAVTIGVYLLSLCILLLIYIGKK